MFDFIKLEVNDLDLCHKLLSNSLLNFSSDINRNTGEIMSDKQTAKYANMVFEIYPTREDENQIPGRVFIYGSLHILFNTILGKAVNHDVFNYRKLRYTINFLSDHFNLDPNKFTIHHLEFGVNIEPSILANKILSSFIVYKKYPFSIMRTIGIGKGIVCYLDEYAIKIYNKSLRYGYNENILRIEKKVNKMRSEFGKQQLKLVDLLDKSIWHKCFESLLKILDQAILFEDVDRSKLTKPDLSLLNECANPLCWEKFSRRQRNQKKERFLEIMQKYSLSKLKKTLKDLITSSANQMLSYSTYHNSSIGFTVACYLPSWNDNFIDDEVEKQVTFPPTKKRKTSNIPTL